MHVGSFGAPGIPESGPLWRYERVIGRALREIGGGAEDTPAAGRAQPFVERFRRAQIQVVIQFGSQADEERAKVGYAQRDAKQRQWHRPDGATPELDQQVEGPQPGHGKVPSGLNWPTG